MKRWQKAMAAIACSGAILIASGVGADPVHASTFQTQAYAPVVLLQPGQDIPFSVQFTAGFQAKVTNLRTKAVTTIDLSANKTKYMDKGIYQADGKLLRTMDGFTQKLVELVPFRDAKGNLRWIGKQIMWGFNNEDYVAVATSVWNVVDNKPQLLSLTVEKADEDNLPSQEVSINSGFSMRGDSTYVLDAKYADVTGDGVKDQILLIGDKMGFSMNQTAKNLRLVVREGKDHQQTIIPVGKRDQGLLPKLAIADGNQDQVKDILVTMPTAAGNVYSQITWKENRPRPVVEQDQLNNRTVYQPVMGVHGEAVAMKRLR